MSSVLVPSFFGSGKILTHIHEPADNSARLIVTSDFTICVSAWNFTTCQLDSRHITLWTVSSDILDCQNEKDYLTKILTFYYFCFVSFKIFDSAYLVLLIVYMDDFPASLSYAPTLLPERSPYYAIEYTKVYLKYIWMCQSVITWMLTECLSS